MARTTGAGTLSQISAHSGELALGPNPQRPLWFFAGWHLVSLVLVVAGPVTLVSRGPLWRLPLERGTQALTLGVGFLVVALFGQLVGRGSPGRALAGLAVIASLTFAALWLVLHSGGYQASRLLFGVGAVLSGALEAMPVLVPVKRGGLLAGLTVVTLTALLLPAPAQSPNPRIDERVTTEFYSVRMRTQSGLLPSHKEIRSGGSVARFGDAFLLVTGEGEFYRLTWQGAGDSLVANRISLKPPLNQDEYLADQPNPARAAIFRVTDMAVADSGASATIYVAHHVWHHQGRCLGLRVSRARISTTSPPDSGAGWETLFESKPCLSLAMTVPRVSTLESGGALSLAAGGLFLSLGDMGSEGLAGEHPYSQDTSVSYGKVFWIPWSGTPVWWSLGHRNPQGLVVAADGRVWETEHGPQGGDELNALTHGGNYGWPLVSYGTQYGIDYWPLAPDAKTHGEFQEPAYVFVPSIGISQLLQLSNRLFPRWGGDLLVGSLRRETLFRVRIRGERAIYAEAIPVGTRIRDLAEGADGRIALWTDRGEIVTVSRAPAAPVGHYIYATRCAGCHEPPPGETVAPAPPLFGIVGRKVASNSEFAYSKVLKGLGGVWSPSRLSQFLEDPASFAPGTMMTFEGVQDSGQRVSLIRFLSEMKRAP